VRDTGRRPWQSAIRAAVGADQILTIHLACLPGRCDVKLERDPAAPGAPLAYSFPLPTHDAGYTTGNLVVYVSTLYPDHPAPGGDLAGKIAPQDQARYVQLVKDYWVGGGALSSDAVLAEVELLRQAAPRSIDVLLFEADILRHRYLQTGGRDRVPRATALLGNDDRLLPDTYSALSARFDLALAADGLDQARALLDRLVLLDPDSSTTHLQRAKLYHKRGELGAARGELDDAAGATRPRGASCTTAPGCSGTSATGPPPAPRSTSCSHAPPATTAACRCSLARSSTQAGWRAPSRSTSSS
jgi:hypothetical protein